MEGLAREVIALSTGSDFIVFMSVSALLYNAKLG